MRKKRENCARGGEGKKGKEQEREQRIGEGRGKRVIGEIGPGREGRNIHLVGGWWW